MFPSHLLLLNIDEKIYKTMERKAFKFYASYYEVYKQLSTPKEKAAFMDALLDRDWET